jgi:hypothetical protein
MTKNYIMSIKKKISFFFLQICRDQFVALHSQPILEDLSKFLQAKYGQLPK